MPYEHLFPTNVLPLIVKSSSQTGTSGVVFEAMTHWEIYTSPRISTQWQPPTMFTYKSRFGDSRDDRRERQEDLTFEECRSIFFSDSRSLHIDTVRWAGDSQSLGGKCESRPPFREHSTAPVCKRRRSKKNPILHPTDSDFRSRSFLGRLLASQRTSISISVVILSSVPFHPHRSLLPFHSNQLLE